MADGLARNVVIVTVVDGTRNALANTPVIIKVPSPAKYSTQPANGLTNSSGKLIIS
ncbi:Ig-like domain-containing protein [Morganella morganii]|nr:Ig-like domain-containing protein [Morganella morganii]MCU6274035.1 Ig-like domain-containing protein [Morganella morganii]